MSVANLLSAFIIACSLTRVLSLSCYSCDQNTPGCYDMDQTVPTKICKEGERCIMIGVKAAKTLQNVMITRGCASAAHRHIGCSNQTSSATIMCNFECTTDLCNEACENMKLPKVMLLLTVFASLFFVV